MLHEEVEKCSRLSGEDGHKTPISRIGGFLDGYETAKEEIVYCEDCKHYTAEAGDDHFALGYCPFINSHLVMSKGFCAWGVKK